MCRRRGRSLAAGLQQRAGRWHNWRAAPPFGARWVRAPLLPLLRLFVDVCVCEGEERGGERYMESVRRVTMDETKGEKNTERESVSERGEWGGAEKEKRIQEYTHKNVNALHMCLSLSLSLSLSFLSLSIFCRLDLIEIKVILCVAGHS